MKTLRGWRSAGIITITVLGFLLHFVYAWTGSSGIIGFFAPVNESVWEHLKLGYWPVALFSVAEFIHIRNRINNFCIARFLGLLAMELTILVIFYGYTFIFEKDILLFDISSFVIGVIVCQYLTYWLFGLRKFPIYYNRLSLAAFIALGILFGIATFYPPHKAIFKDSRNNTFGIYNEK